MAIAEAPEPQQTVRQDLGYDLDPAKLTPLPLVEIAPKPLHDWTLDEATRAIGRRGIAQSRAALRAARADHLDRAEPVDHL